MAFPNWWERQQLAQRADRGGFTYVTDTVCEHCQGSHFLFAVPPGGATYALDTENYHALRCPCCLNWHPKGSA